MDPEAIQQSLIDFAGDTPGRPRLSSYAWGNDQITTAIIEVPAIPSANAARRYERKYLEMQSAELDTRYQETQKELKGEPSLSARARVGELIAGQ